MTFHHLINAPAAVTLAAGIAADATSITVSGDLGITAPFKATFASTGEIIEVGSASGTAWSSIVRGAEGTTPAAYATGSGIELRLTAGHLTERQPFNAYPSASAAENTLAIRAAIASGHVSLAPGTYPVARTGTETELFLLTDEIEFNGNGATIIVASDTPNTVDVFRFDSTGKGSLNNGTHFHDFHVYPAAPLAGRHCFNFDNRSTDSTDVWMHVNFDNITIGRVVSNVYQDFSGYAIYGTCPTNYNGNIPVSRFKQMRIVGGVFFDSLGDSVTFQDIWLWDRRHIGFDVTLVANAGQTRFDCVNATATYGAIAVALSGNSNVKIRDCNLEHVVSTACTKGAIVYVTGGMDVTVSDNRIIQVNPGANDHGLSFVNVQHVTATNNQLQGYGTGYDLKLDADSDDNYAPQGSNRLFQARYSNLGTTRAAL